MAAQSRPQFCAPTARRPDRIVLFMGAPGSGKGTQSAMLASVLGIRAISTGEILREAAKDPGPRGIRLRKIMASGGLVDDATVCETVIARIRNIRKGSAGLILDGFPRTIAQAKRLDRVLKGLGMPKPIVLHLDVPQEVILRRLSLRRQCPECGAIFMVVPDSIAIRCKTDGSVPQKRDDDDEAVVIKRLMAYDAETRPVLDYYRSPEEGRSIYRRIDGCLSAAEIAKGVCDIVSFAGEPLAA